MIMMVMAAAIVAYALRVYLQRSTMLREQVNDVRNFIALPFPLLLKTSNFCKFECICM